MSEKIRVFITRRLPGIAPDILKEHFLVDGSSENRPLPREELAKVVAEYDAVLATVSEKFDREIIGRKKNLSVISNYAVGLDNIDLESAAAYEIAVYNTPDAVTDSTADLTFALLFSLIRKIPAAQDFVRSGRWNSWDPELFLGEELRGKTFGILGFGKIGQAVAKRAAGFGLEIIYHNRPLLKYPNHNFFQVKLDYLLENSDYISIHLPLTDETAGYIDNSKLNLMKKKPVILNMARGGIVNTDDLYSALQSGQIRGACLDVTAPEPLSGSHPLCKLDNCLIVPHIGTATQECRKNMARDAAQNIIDHFHQTGKI